MVSPPFNKSFKGGDTIWVTLLFGGDAIWETFSFGGDTKKVINLFGGDAVFEISSTRKPNFEANSKGQN